MPRSCYQMQHALPERIGAKQKRLPREAAFVSATTIGETTVTLHVQTGIRHGQAAQASDSVQAHYGAAQAQPISQVDEIVARLNHQIGFLQDAVTGMRNRLAPVLTPEADPAPSGSQDGPVRSLPPPLVGQLESLSERLHLAVTELQMTDSRLAL